MKRMLFVLCLTFSTQSHGAWIVKKSKVESVGSSFEPNMACVYLENGDVVKIDLNTQTGKAELSIALTVKATKKDLKVLFSDSQALVGGCNTGTTIQPHGILSVEE